MRKSLKTHIKFQKPTFIHSKPKLTFGKKHGSYSHITAAAKMNPSYLTGGDNVHPLFNALFFGTT